MKYGLNKEICDKIDIIIRKNKNYKFKIFGSRARGDFKNTSDIDIAIFENVTKEKEYEIRNEFDKLDIIYKIDLVFIDNTIKKELLDSIIRDGVDF